MKKKVSQKSMIRKHLEEGKSLTPLEALHMFGSFRLAAHIHTLREEGMNIVTDESEGYAKYSLL